MMYFITAQQPTQVHLTNTKLQILPIPFIGKDAISALSSAPNHIIS
jgi:hypothetical protein